MSENKQDVGTPTPGQAMKNRWRKEGEGVSLKTFARQLAKAGDQGAKDWFEVKKGALNSGRSDKNKARVEGEATATKASKKSKGKK